MAHPKEEPGEALEAAAERDTGAEKVKDEEVSGIRVWAGKKIRSLLGKEEMSQGKKLQEEAFREIDLIEDVIFGGEALLPTRSSVEPIADEKLQKYRTFLKFLKKRAPENPKVWAAALRYLQEMKKRAKEHHIGQSEFRIPYIGPNVAFQLPSASLLMELQKLYSERIEIIDIFLRHLPVIGEPAGGIILRHRDELFTDESSLEQIMRKAVEFIESHRKFTDEDLLRYLRNPHPYR